MEQCEPKFGTRFIQTNDLGIGAVWSTDDHSCYMVSMGDKWIAKVTNEDQLKIVNHCFGFERRPTAVINAAIKEFGLRCFEDFDAYLAWDRANMDEIVGQV